MQCCQINDFDLTMSRGNKRQKMDLIGMDYQEYNKEKKYWENWYLQKQYHYACSKDEFLIILKIMTKNNMLAELIHKDYYIAFNHRKSRFRLSLSLSLISLPYEKIRIIPCKGHYSNILQVSFLYELSSSPLSILQLATSSFSFFVLAKRMNIPISLLSRIIIWNTFKEILFDISSITLNPLLQYIMKNIPCYNKGDIEISNIYKLSRQNDDSDKADTKTKIRLLLDQFERKPGFLIPGVLFPQHLGQMDLENIDWKSMCKSISKLFPTFIPCESHLVIQMLRMFGSIFYSCNIPVLVNDSLCIEFCRKEVT